MSEAAELTENSPACTRPAAEKDAANETPGLNAGDLVDRYVIIRRIGAGGMGEVLEAYDPDLSRKVALKFFLPPERRDGESADARAHIEQQRRGLIEEARTLAKLEHPNIVRVYDIGTWSDRVYMAMELVLGQNLRAWTDGHRPSWRELLPVYAQLADALSYLHQRSVVHRDFKPDNVLIDADGAPKLVDFGLAFQGDSDAQKSMRGHRGGHAQKLDSVTVMVRSGDVQAGTPSYMAPEQMLGERLTNACDQYAFFVSLYESLYRKRPFHAPSRELLLIEKQRSSLRFPSIRPVVPKRVIQLIRTGLEPRPDDRHPSMHRVAIELRRKPGRRWGVTSIAVLVIAAMGTGIAERIDTEYQRQLACDAKLAPMAKIWNPKRLSEVRSSYRESEDVRAVSVFHELEHELRRRVDDWTKIANETCRTPAANPSRALFREEQQQSELCLQTCLQELEQFIDAVDDASDTQLEKVSMVADSLCEPQKCRAGASSEDDNLLPRDFARRVEAIKILAELNQMNSQATLSGGALERSKLHELHERAKDLGYLPVIAQVELVSMVDQVHSGEVADVVERGYRILDIGTQYRLSSMTLGVLPMLVFTVGVRGRDVESALELARLSLSVQQRSSDFDVVLDGPANHVAAVLGTAGRMREAEMWVHRASEQILSRYENIVISNPQHFAAIEFHTILNNLSVIRYYRGKYAEARVALERYDAWYKSVYPKLHTNNLFPRSNMALILEALGEYEASVTHALDCIEIGNTMALSWNEALIRARYVVADAALRQGDGKKARKWIQEAMDGRAALDGENSPFLIIERSRLAKIEAASGNQRDALAAADDAMHQWQANPSTVGPVPDLFEAFLRLASIYIDGAKWKNAEQCIKLAQSWQPENLEILEPRNALLWITQAELAWKRDKAQSSARNLLDKAIKAPGVRADEIERARALLSQIDSASDGIRFQ